MDTILQELIEMVKAASEFLWEVAVRQVYVDAIMSLVYLVILVIIFIVLRKYFRKYSSGEDADTDAEGFFGYCMILVGGLILLALFHALSEAPNMLNPNYHAIQKLINLVPGQ